MKFSQAVVFGVGVFAAVQQRDLATFQSTLESLTGEVSDLDIAINGIASQVKVIADDLEKQSAALDDQPKLDSVDSIILLTPFDAFRKQVSSTMDHLLSQKGSIEASSSCKDVRFNIFLARVWYMVFAGTVVDKTDPDFTNLYEDIGNRTSEKFESAFEGLKCSES